MIRQSEVIKAGRANDVVVVMSRSSLMRFVISALSLLLPLLTASGQGGQQQPQRQAPGSRVVDYMVATVNGSLITYSDLIWQLAIQPDTPLDNPPAEDLKRTLELLIDQRLIFMEAEKMPHIHAEDKEVETALGELVRRFPSQTEFQQRVTRVGLTTERLREIVSERVEIEKYLNFRFRSFTIVTPKEIEDYYRDVWVPRFRERAPGRIVPKFEDVRAEIESTLTESKIESDTSKYLDEARDKAEIIILRQL